MGFPSIKSDGGVLCIIYSFSGGGKRPIHGAYYAGEEQGWVPLSWFTDGTYVSANSGIRSGLDITKAILDIRLGQEKPPPTIQETS